MSIGRSSTSPASVRRATNEYRHALETNDNTEGAQDEARKYLKQPYEKQKSTPGS